MSGTFPGENVTALIGWIFLSYAPAVAMSQSMDRRDTRGTYDKNRKKIRCAPPGWLFGVAWTILYGLQAASLYIYFAPTVGYEASEYFIAAMVLAIAMIILDLVWTTAFFTSGRISFAMAVIVAQALTSTALAIMLGLSGAWVSFGLLMPRVVWVAFAATLNAQFTAVGYTSTRTSKQTRRAVDSKSVPFLYLCCFCGVRARHGQIPGRF